MHIATLPKFQILEHAHQAQAHKARIAKTYPTPVDGAFMSDDKPGLGVAVDEAAVEKFSI